ncbi:MAG: lytic transglycosylase domain-containing protein [Rubrimonas sp.]|uniref:lytic transglycosylase domain-containing protein n=1 Tax=Rubrimonas sp. TaxID=2036015 RepID=UPI002FDEB22C
MALISATSTPVARADEAAALGAALDLADSVDPAAAQAAARLRDPVARDLTRWRALTRGEASFAEAAAFLAARPDWPRADAIRRESERAMPPTTSAAALRAFFGAAPPQTGSGALALAQAVGGAQGQEILAAAWTTLPLTQAERETFQARHPELTRRLATARLDEMLWRGETEQARAIMPFVGADWRALAEARLALRARANGVDALIARVPAALSNDAGLAYERFLWRIGADRDPEAEQLLQQRTGSAAALGRPELWAARRERLARAALRSGRVAEAYRLASLHQLSDGARFAELEWLSGWIALRGLRDPKRAAAHFDAHRRAVSTPISLGRAGYWLGRAHEEMGDASAARRWFEAGAEHATSFYGQLAAEKIGRDIGQALSDEAPLPAPDPLLRRNDLARAAELLQRAGHTQRARLFLLHAADIAGDRETFAQLGALALRMGRPELAIRIGKTAAAKGHVILPLYYPLHDSLARVDRVEPALAKAIARTESELNPEAVSSAGARGLMQLMPATAQATARSLGLSYDRDRLTTDPAYNARLGSAYLAEMLDRFGGAKIMATAAYNAGPQRVDAWIAQFGDPREGGVDAVDWIESIPFRETRNYVQRVMESLHVYRARLGGAEALAGGGFAASLTRRAG